MPTGAADGPVVLLKSILSVGRRPDGSILPALPPRPHSSVEAIPFPDGEPGRGIVTRFEQVAARLPDRLALTCAEIDLSFHELNALANGVAQAVTGNLRADQRTVAIFLPNSPMAIVGILGVLKAGRCVLPLDPCGALAYNRRLLDEGEATLILTDSTHAALAGELARLGETVLDVESFGTALAPPDLPIGADDPVCLNVSSGSTGRPKAVVQTHRLLLAECRRQQQDLAVTPADRFGWLTPAFSSAALRDIFGSLLSGASLAPLDAREAGLVQIARWIRQRRLTILHLTPSLLRSLEPHLHRAKRASSLRLLSLGAESVLRRDFDIYRRHFGPSCVFQVVYGSTETRVTAQCFLTHRSRIDDTRLPVGWPVHGKSIDIRDDEWRILPPGETGEIVVRSRSLAAGYWKQPDLTRLAFEPAASEQGERAYRTGDLGRIDEFGRLNFVGRVDGQVKIRGSKVLLSEVEDALMVHRAVSEAAASVWSDGRNNDRLVAYVTYNRTAIATASELREFLAPRLPSSSMPHRFVFLDALPRLPGGKLDRAALPPPTLPNRREHEKSRQCTPMEARIARIWEAVLEVEGIGPDEDFFELGGDSLLAAIMVDRLEQELRLSLPIGVLRQNRTLEALASFLESSAQDNASQHLVRLNPGGKLAPLILLPGRATTAMTFYPLARRLGADQPLIVIEYKGLSGREPPDTSIPAMAASAIAALREAEVEGPFQLCGHSLGGIVAFEMARQLLEAGDSVLFIGLMDTALPQREKLRSQGRLHRRRLTLSERFGPRLYRRLKRPLPPRLRKEELIRIAEEA
jgi:amino acid adenylation domain-containing protein